jgi:hypothetical protein
MKKWYLHLSAYPCDKCKGPVISGSLTVRENEISKETDIRQIGARCLSCGHQQSKASDSDATRDFPPVEWHLVNLIDTPNLATAFGEMLSRAT